MTYVDLNIKLRPIRLAFLVNPQSVKEVLQSIEINTFLWGGTFNPIVPNYRRLPKAFKVHGRETAKGVVTGYLDSFDPDYLVAFRNEIDCAELSKYWKRTVVPGKAIIDSIRKRGLPSYGVGLYEILNDLIENEFKFVRREPMGVVAPKLSREYRLFLASAFGYLSPETAKIFNESYRDKIEAREATVSLGNFTRELMGRQLLRRLTALYKLDVRRKSYGIREAYLFYLDASKPIDIIDFWNLRASGLGVMPYPKQAVGYAECTDDAAQFLKRNYFPLAGNSTVYHSATILKSRSLQNREYEDFVKRVSTIARKDGEKLEIIVQPWYPELWNKWQVEQEHVTICQLESTTVSHELHSTDERISYEVVSPDFGANGRGDISPRFANVINLKSYGRDQLYAEVIPSAAEANLAEAFNLARFYELRFSKHGLVRMQQFYNYRDYLYLPKSEDVFSEWLKEAGWKSVLSDKGRLAKQMLKQLRGTLGINILALDGVVRLLGGLSEGKTISQENLRAELSKIANTQLDLETSHLLQRLTDVQILRLGIELQCPICTQKSWYSLKETDYEVLCLKCLDRFAIPAHSPKELKWAYRSFGPFSLPSQAYGAYTVLLALRFFATVLDGSTTPIMSFTAKKGGKEIESDLGLLYKRYSSSTKFRALFVECKTYNSFETKDARRMQFLGEQFPGAVLVFASLKEQLTDKEKRILRAVVNRSRKAQRKGRSYNPILILTATELFAKKYPPICWQDIPSIEDRFKKWYTVATDLVHFADATQQLYLDIPGYEYLPLAEP